MINSQDLMALDAQDVLHTYARFPVAFASGSGATLRDFEGKRYIDFSSGIGVNSVGYAHPKWIAAVTDQAGKLAHISNLFYTEPCVRLAGQLNARSGMSAAFFANSGAESNEGLIKLARKYSFDKYGKGRSNIVTLHHSFHGRTVTTLAATGQDVFHNYFFPFTEGFRYAEPGDLDSVRAAAGEDSCAVLLELVQGEGGVLPMEPAFVQALEALCREKDLLLLVDEVQTGVGRTGTLFAFQQYGIEPDAVSFAKGIAGGLPLGGFLVNARCRDVLGPGTHATTFGGNPICCAAGCAVLDILDDAALKAVAEKGAWLKNALLALDSPYIAEVRGLGLMLGIAIQNYSHRDLVARLLDNGLVCLTAGSDTVRLLPPLTISQAELEAGVDIFRKVLEELK